MENQRPGISTLDFDHLTFDDEDLDVDLGLTQDNGEIGHGDDDDKGSSSPPNSAKKGVNAKDNTKNMTADIVNEDNGPKERKDEHEQSSDDDEDASTDENSLDENTSDEEEDCDDKYDDDANVKMGTVNLSDKVNDIMIYKYVYMVVSKIC